MWQQVLLAASFEKKTLAATVQVWREPSAHAAKEQTLWF